MTVKHDIYIKSVETELQKLFLRKIVHTVVPGHVMWQEGIRVTFSGERIWGSKVSWTSCSSSVARLLPFLLSSHALQQADLLLLLLFVPQLPLIRLEGVAVAWECGEFLRHFRERVTCCLAILVTRHLALRATVRRNTIWIRKYTLFLKSAAWSKTDESKNMKKIISLNLFPDKPAVKHLASSGGLTQLFFFFKLLIFYLQICTIFTGCIFWHWTTKLGIDPRNSVNPRQEWGVCAFGKYQNYSRIRNTWRTFCWSWY